MSPRPPVVLAVLVVLAGCAGAGPPGSADGPTAATQPAPDAATAGTAPDTTEPHTARGTSHAGEHFSVRASYGVENVTVTVAPDDGDRSQFELSAGDQRSVTRPIHDRGHDVRVVVERDGTVVFDETVAGHQYYRLAVSENDTSVTLTVV